MNAMRLSAPRSARLLFLLALCLAYAPALYAQNDPLPSWNDTPVKHAIIDFVRRVTSEGQPGFVPVEQRIATFDNDGTLWVEKPVPNEVYFVLDRVRHMAERDPSLRQKQPFKAALEGDSAYFQRNGPRALAELVNAAYADMTQEQFAAEARKFLQTRRHPKLNRPFPATAYQPMLELLSLLRANGFQIWICSGGTVDFMRIFAHDTYDVPLQQVIGSVMRREFRLMDGRWMIWRLPGIESINDRDTKPLNIDRQIGIRPLFVAGNVMSGGDIAMMEYSKGRVGPSFQLLINHDDAQREFAYQEKDNESINAAREYGFTVVSIRRDWNRVLGTMEVGEMGR